MKNINWRNTLFLTLTPIAALISVPLYLHFTGFSWWLVAMFVSFYVVSNMAITCGYHRYFAHRSYDIHPILEFIYVFFGSGAFQGSVLEWAADHRIHHSKVDTDQDPYSINKGFWYAHIGWLFVKSNEPMDFPKDLASKKLLQFQHKHYALVSTLVGFGLPWIVGEMLGLGLGGLIFGGIFRVVCTQHSTFFVNSFAHTFGTQPYSTKHTAKDSLVVALLTFGEGYHNYHHEFQYDYRCAIKWYQWDPTKWTIRMFWLMGLVSKLRQVSHYDVAMARIHLESDKLALRGIPQEKFLAMKQKFEEAQKQAKILVLDYQKRKEILKEQSQEKYLELKADMKVAILEFEYAYKQWKIYNKMLLKSARA
jgi:stearoyl-CoA desaturase (delta-9 desaturase)